MNKNNLAYLLCKFFGIYWITKAVMALFPFWSIAWYKMDNSVLYFSAISSLGYILVGLLFYLKAKPLSLRMVSDQLEEENFKLDYQSLQSIIFSSIGLWLLINTIPELLNSIGQLESRKHSSKLC